MSRDHTRLRVFDDAHRLVLAIYCDTREFPKDEWFGIRVQLRRAAVSIPSNIVEGNARRTTRDYLRFLEISLGSACELKYLISLSRELRFVTSPAWNDAANLADSVVKQLERLVQTMAGKLATEKGPTLPP